MGLKLLHISFWPAIVYEPMATWQRSWQLTRNINSARENVFLWCECIFWHWCCVSIIYILDDIIKWKHFPCHWPFVRGIHQSPVDSPHKDQWHRTLIFSLICAWTNHWANNWDAGDLRCHCTHYHIIVILFYNILTYAICLWSTFMASEDMRTIRLSQMRFPVLARWFPCIEMGGGNPSSLVKYDGISWA